MNSCPQGGICSLALNFLYIINTILVPLLFAIAFLMFLYGVAQAYIFSKGDQEAVQKGHLAILWGIIGFVVMISLWGLVNVVATTFGLQNQSLPSLPQSPSFLGTCNPACSPTDVCVYGKCETIVQ